MVAAAPPTRQPPWIRHATIGDHVVVLDLAGNGYHVLDEVAARMWRIAVDDTVEPGDAVATLVDEFHAEAALIASDYACFVNSAIDDGLLLPRTAKPAPSTFRTVRFPLFPIFSAWLSIVKTVWSLRFRGLACTYDEVRSLALGMIPRERPQLASALAKFSVAENFMLLRRAPKDCLPRSLALFRFLCAMGFPARHVIGVDLAPFRAHAWVEVHGEVVLDADWRGSYTVIASIDP
jgi:hypothetical protein